MKKLQMLFLPALTVILELLPWGAVLNYESRRYLYPYFSLVPFGYANFGPLLTALSSVVLLVLSAVAAFRNPKKWRTGLLMVCVVAALFSLMPLLFGIRNFSVVGAMISLCLIGQFALLGRKAPHKEDGK